MFCQGLEETDSGHTRKQCPLFKSLKSKTSTSPYISVELKPSESVGYAAAGILPWRRTNIGEIEILLTREYRPKSYDNMGGDKLNFLGGKRHKQESDPLTCAADKVYDETGGQLSPATIAHMREECPLVCWSSKSKYVLFVFELVGEDDREVDIRCAGVTGAKRLEWATRRELLSSTWRRKEMHGFALEIMEQLTSCQIMSHLEQLFDVASAPLEPTLKSQDQQPQEGLTPAEVSKHFDIVGAIRTTLESARPSERSPLGTSSCPPYEELRAAVRIIPKRDMKKLQLRFHPDELVRVLRRAPSDEEERMSTSAIQVLNGLVGDDGDSKMDIMDSLGKLNNQRGLLLATKSGGSPGKQDNLKEVEDLLSRLSVRP